MTKKYTIGLDYGTDSVRAVIVDTADGTIAGSSVFDYPRWKQGKYCDPQKNCFRQHPLDYIEGALHSIKGALQQAPAGTAGQIAALTVDTTGSTPVAVDRNGTPLALLSGFEDDPDAMFILWKDHTAVKEAAEINTLCKTWGGTDYTQYVGGIYSSEWFWAKILHTLRNNKKVSNAAWSWVEHCDWITALLTGQTDPLKIRRSRCAAGHKAMWHETYGGLPSEEFLVKLDPLLKGLRSRLYNETFTCDVAAGHLSDEWAKKLGVSPSVIVGTGSFDAHLGAVGGEIKPYYLSKVMGTSTCDMMIVPRDEIKGKTIRGICGQVDGSVIPGMIGMEAGQSAFGDIYAWYKKMLMWPAENILRDSTLIEPALRQKLIEEIEQSIISRLSEAALKIPPGESGIVALDWMNGRRTPDANQELKGVIAGLNLGSDAPRIFKALVEATAFGAKKIVDRFIDEGIPIKGVIALGGVAKKSPFVMQIVADVLNMPIRVARSEQTCALGAAMAAAVAAGIYPTLEKAQEAMGSGFEKEYIPNPEHAAIYNKLYLRYCRLGEGIENQWMS